jgi:hypothetical protein
MRRLQDLSGLDSNLVLAEYCEQYPPLLNQIGMATRIKNYFKKVFSFFSEKKTLMSYLLLLFRNQANKIIHQC